MSDHRTVLLNTADIQTYAGPILNPHGEKIIDVITTHEAGDYPALLGPAQNVGDIVLVRLAFGAHSPNGQTFKLAAMSPGNLNGGSALFWRQSGGNPYVNPGLQLTKAFDPHHQAGFLSLQFLGRDWLVLGVGGGWEPLVDIAP